MGRTLAAHCGHRLSLLVVAIIEFAAEIQDWIGVHAPNTIFS